jgi:hypothetical protein
MTTFADLRALGGKPAASAPRGNEVTGFDALRGSPSPRSEAPTVEPPASTARETSSPVGRVVKPIVAGTADLIDLGLVGLPAMAVGVSADITNRVIGLFDSRSRAGVLADSEMITRTIQEAAGTPIRTLLTNLGAIDKTDETAISKAMGAVSEALDKTGASIEEGTGGKIAKQDFLSVANTLMVSLGGLGLGKSVTAYGKRADVKVQDAGRTAMIAERQAENAIAGEAQAKGMIKPFQRRGPTPPSIEPVRGERTGSRDAVDLGLAAPAPRPVVQPEGGIFSSAEQLATRDALRTRGLASLVPEVPGGKLTRPVSSLDSGLAKIRSGNLWSMTPEERIAVRGSRIVTDPKILTAAVVGATGLGLAMTYEPDAGEAALAIGAGALVMGKGHGLTLEALKAVPDATPLGRIREQMATSLSTIEMLPGNRFEFTKDAVGQLLRRQEVTKAERDILQGVLDATPGETITAKQLVAGFKERTGDFELKAKQTDTFADYGLDRVGRTEDDAYANTADPNSITPGVRATTTIWQSPLELGTTNHFGDPNYFAHTRSFEEGGVKHVIEIQSDVAQKAGKELTPGEKARLETYQTQLTAERTNWLEAIKGLQDSGSRVLDELQARGKDAGSPEWQTFLDRRNESMKRYRAAQQDVEARMAEVRSKLDETGVAERIAPVRPMFKSWHKRLIREELAASARGKTNPEYAAAREELKNKVRYAKSWEGPHTAVMEQLQQETQADAAKLLAIPERLPPEPIVRFATADTVAKVEGWPDTRPYLEQTGRTRPTFSPEHQGIYDRYAGDITKFLRQLGGKEVTDPLGHTWIEVPTAGTPKFPAGKRVQQFGGADPRLAAYAATVLGAGALAAFFTDPPDDPDAPNRKISNAIMTSSLVAIAGLGVLAKSRIGPVAERAQSFLTTVEDRFGNTNYQMEKISPPVERATRNYYRRLGVALHSRLQATATFVEGMHKASSVGGDALAAATLSGDWPTVIRSVGALGRPELIPALATARGVLADIGKEMVKLGLLKGLIPDYFPRSVKDLPGLLNELGKPARDFLEHRLKQAEDRAAARGSLDELERAAVINKALLESIYSKTEGATFRGKRTIPQVTAQLAKYYDAPAESFAAYIAKATNAIERARFFGKDALIDPKTGLIDVNSSIGNLILREKQAGRLTPLGEKELTRLLKVQFDKAHAAPDWFIQTAESLTTAALLGNIGSALMNLTDIPGTTASLHGILPTLKSLRQVATRNPQRITNLDQGLIDIIGEEFTNRSSHRPVIVQVPGIGPVHLSAAKFLNRVLKFAPFTALDAFTKEVHTNAGAIKSRAQLSTPKGETRFIADNAAYFGDDLPQLIADLRAGKKSELVLELAWKHISDAQPISPLEMPTARTANPNWRFAWQMKTWMTKQMTLMRKEGIAQIRAGNWAQGLSHISRWAIMAGAAGASMTWIIDSLLWGRDRELEWGDIPLAALKNFGASAYAADLFAQGRPGAAVAGFLAPPVMVLWDIAAGKPEAVKYLPIIGKPIYMRLMGGAEKANAKAERKREAEERKLLEGQ